MPADHRGGVGVGVGSDGANEARKMTAGNACRRGGSSSCVAVAVAFVKSVCQHEDAVVGLQVERGVRGVRYLKLQSKLELLERYIQTSLVANR